jgi:siroheme synthase (precorrin-2 oxidase/ferrochelatase)
MVCPGCHEAIHSALDAGLILPADTLEQKWLNTVIPLRAHIEERQVWWNQLCRKRKTRENDRELQELSAHNPPKEVEVKLSRK